MKSYTNIEQSRKLAEFLPFESADFQNKTIESNAGEDVDDVSYVIHPCWSLAALLSVLPDYTLQTNTDGTVFVVCESKKPMISDAYDNPIDACYEMIVKLHELNLL